MRSMQQWGSGRVKNKILDTLVNRFYTRSTEDDYTKNMAYPHV